MLLSYTGRGLLNVITYVSGNQIKPSPSRKRIIKWFKIWFCFCFFLFLPSRSFICYLFFNKIKRRAPQLEQLRLLISLVCSEKKINVLIETEKDKSFGCWRKYCICIYEAVDRCWVSVLLDTNIFIVEWLLETPVGAPENEAIVVVIGRRRIHIDDTIQPLWCTLTKYMISWLSDLPNRLKL